MRVIVALPTELPNTENEETVLLVPSDWDDYSYRTEFSVSYWPVGEPPIRVGTTKILAKTYKEDRLFRTCDEIGDEETELEPGRFCSLSTEGWYYDRLGKLPNDAGRRILRALNDVCFSDITDQWWIQHPGFDLSLLRYSSAHIARRSAADLFAGRPFEGDFKNKIRYHQYQGEVRGGPRIFEAQFDGTLQVPGRLHVIVGKNGVGKTSLLAGLANWFGRNTRRDQLNFKPEFSRVLVLSYNPFDEAMRDWVATEGNVRYLGRRPPNSALLSLLEDGSRPDIDPENWWQRLRQECTTPKELREKLGTLSVSSMVTTPALALKGDKTWNGFLLEALDDARLVELLVSSPQEAYAEMSAGQRALIGLWAELYVNMAPQSLVLLDEPENFLHPSLIGRFARSFNTLLAARKSFSIVATHSPIVTQETPARFVSILEREGNETTSRHPDFETFGESTDNLSERLFETDFRSSHWKKVLSDFGKQGLGLDEAAGLVSGLKLPLLAETYLIYQRHGREKS